MDRLTRFLLSFFGLGLMPFASGTFGTAGAFAVAWLLPERNWTLWAAGVFAVACLLTVALGKQAERVGGGKDPGFVVTDEVAGYFVTVAALEKPEPGWLLVGFFLFRIFDIWKPWPVRRLEKLPGGVGVLVDDLAAGLYGLIVLLALHALTGWSGAL